MMRNGIIQAAGFLLAVQFSELIVECAKHYNALEREIVAPDGRLLANLGEISIRGAFGIPKYHGTVYKTKEEAIKMYEDHTEEYETNINKL